MKSRNFIRQLRMEDYKMIIEYITYLIYESLVFLCLFFGGYFYAKNNIIFIPFLISSIFVYQIAIGYAQKMNLLPFYYSLIKKKVN